MRSWFDRWTKRKAAPPGRDPLLAVPRVAPGATAVPSNGGMLVTRKVQLRSLMGRLAARLGGRPSVRVVLDERGAFFWDRIDGQRSLAVIANELQAQFVLDAAVARWCVIEFTKQLMRRNLVELKVEK